MLGKGKKSLISATHAHPQQPLDGSNTERDRERVWEREGGGDKLAEQKRKSVLHRWMGENCRTAVIEIVSQPAMRFTYAPACVCICECVCMGLGECECVCMYCTCVCIYLCLLWASLTCFQYNKRKSICQREEIVYAPPARVELLLPKNNEATHICTCHTHTHKQTHTFTLA